MSVSPTKKGSTLFSGQFLPFLPKDNQTWQADEIIRSINDSLSSLLSSTAEDFWSTVRKDESLHVCLDTYLRYKRRVYDDFREEVEGASAISHQLARRVFMVLLRMVTTCDRDPGGPDREQQAKTLYDMWLLDIPKLMDVAVLYNTHNPDLTRRFLNQVFELQTRYSDDLAATAPLLVGNLAEVVRRCGAAGDRVLKVGVAAGAPHLKELRDAVDYLRDATLTLTAFVACYTPAAAALLAPDHGALLCTLASAHDRLLPQLGRLFSQPSGQLSNKTAAGTRGLAAEGANGKASGDDDVVATLSQAATGLRRLGYLLLLYGSCGALPPGARRSPKPAPQVAEARGNELMSLLMAVSSAATAAGGGGDGGSVSGFLALINRESHLDAQVAAAMLEGTLALDDAQFDYLLALIGGDPRIMDRVREQRQQGCMPSVSAASGGSSGASGADPGPSRSSAAGASTSGAGTSDPAATVQKASLISQIKDLLPDYGDGFLAACLETMGNNPERVINALLEDNLPAHLATLDRKLATWGGPVSQTGAGPSSSGAASAGTSNALAAMSSWNSLAGLASVSAASSAAAGTGSFAKVASGSGAGFWRTAAGGGGGGGNGGNLHRGTLKVLNRLDMEVKALTSRLGDELQWEYDDEYDDSFDDLAAGGADGVADAEGDDDDTATARRARDAAAVGPGPGRPGGVGRYNLAASADYNDAPNGAPYSSRGEPTAFKASASRREEGAATGSQGAGRPSTAVATWTADVAATAAAAAASAAVTATAGSGPSAALRRASMMIGQAAAGPGAAQASSGAASSDGRGGRGGPRGRADGGKLWVLDGKIYNYAKEGAQMVNSRQEADAVMDAARQAALAIHGLGPGGNKGLMLQQQQQRQQHAASGNGNSDEGGQEVPGTNSRAGGGRGGQGGRGSGQDGGGGGGDRRQYDRKEKNKAAVSNHHRKDRALRKQGLL